MKAPWTILALPWLLAGLLLAAGPAAPPRMHWADDSSGRPFSKDPSVVRFGDRYLMYYSLPPSPAAAGASASPPAIICSTGSGSGPSAGPGLRPARVGRPRRLGARRQGAPVLPDLRQRPQGCHLPRLVEGWPDLHRNPENPVFAPTGDWTAGRAIDAEVHPVGDRLFLWFATRDPKMEIQMLGSPPPARLGLRARPMAATDRRPGAPTRVAVGNQVHRGAVGDGARRQAVDVLRRRL